MAVSYRLRRAPTLVFMLIALWAIVVLVTLIWGIQNAESKLSEETRSALDTAGIAVSADFSGRDATLRGTVAADTSVDDIVALVDAIPGVRNVSSEIEVVAPPEPVIIQPRIAMRVLGNAITLRGDLPSEEVRLDLVEAAEDQYGLDRVADVMDVGDNVTTEPWLGRIKDVFAHLDGLRSGGFTATAEGFVIDGQVASDSVRAGIEQEITLILDDTLPFESNLTIAVLPVPTFSASGDAGVVTLDGSFPNQETTVAIADAARRLYPGKTIFNSMQVGEVAGLPWLELIPGLLDVVTRLDPWTVEIRDETVTIEGLSLDQDLVDAIDVLTEEVVGGQLAVVTDVQVDPEAIAIQLTQLLEGVTTFEFNDATLSAEGIALLDEAIEILRANPAARLIVEGHTDDQGAAADNLELSQQRADAVVAYLVAGGIEADRLTAVGFGEERPIADNVTEAGRAQNRRIEFVIEEGDG